MQISLRWLKELVNLETISVETLITKLTLGGFEVEEVLEVELGNETTLALDISSTANRSDSLSIQGLSLEIAALLNHNPSQLAYSTKTYPWSQEFESLISNDPIQTNCSGFISLMIENLNSFKSPKWLQQKLISSGFPVENNLTDFQNYILVETGYPLEFYDFDKITAKVPNSKIQLSLKGLEEPYQFLARNGNQYLLEESVLVVKADDLPISIGGIIASNETTYSMDTKTLLVEASIFNAAQIRQQSRILGLRTDRSARYEKSIKNTTLLEAIYRFISLLRIENPNLICKLHTISKPIKDPVRTIQLSYEKVKQVLGPIQKTKTIDADYISPQLITEALTRLQFQMTYDSPKGNWDIIIPSFRNDDIVRDIDVIEEIGRLYGFNNFLTRLPPIKNLGKEDWDYRTRKKLTSCLINLGLTELIQYSLVNQESYFKNEVELINPLVKDYSKLRSSLLPNLLKAVDENFKKGNSVLEGFEYGHIFSLDSSSLILEREVVAGVFGGFSTKSNWSATNTQLSWFEAKGRMEQLFKKLNICIYWQSYQPIREKNIFHFYCTAEIFLSNGTKLGIFGQVSPILAKKLNISTNIYLFELEFEPIKDQLKQNKLAVYQDYSSYPKIIKDLSFIVKDNISFSKIKEVLYINGSQFLKEINLLDEYRGQSIPSQHTSLCLQLIFQSDVETLQTENVETILTNLTTILTDEFDATIRV
uniref:Phenylalanine--tRNA ligase beta subunit, chloroplastic n=1 Tax=Nitzschia palea TaxID=303400 RepID=A0A3S5HPE5_9STRA|nr:phenylalanine tRNA synthetase beta subunit [Nitzschia palea]